MGTRPLPARRAARPSTASATHGPAAPSRGPTGSGVGQARRGASHQLHRRTDDDITTATENPDAGRGPVLLDIGGDVGALIVTLPAETEGLEVEIRPKGATALKVAGQVADPRTRAHVHPHIHTHDPEAKHDDGPVSFPHVAVVGRSAPSGVHHCLVYPSLPAGDYELCPMPGDDIVLTATVVGGEVTQLTPIEQVLRLPWPGRPPTPSAD